MAFNMRTVIESVKTLISPQVYKSRAFKHGKCLLYTGINNIYHAYPHL